MKTRNTTIVVSLGVLVLVVLPVGIYLLGQTGASARQAAGQHEGELRKPAAPPAEEEPGKKQNPPSDAAKPAIEAMVQEAYQLQQARKWCEAEAKWAAVLQQLEKAEKGERNTQRRREAEGNRDILRELCKPEEPVHSIERTPPENERPEALSKETLLKFYPEGRELKSRGILRIRGVGVNADWGIKAERHFTYWSQVEAISRVLKNDGQTAEFEIQFPRVQQVSDWTTAQVELDLPDDPIANIVFDRLATKVPAFFLVKAGGEIAMIFDPKLKGVLGALHRELERAGLGGKDQSEFAARLSELEGQAFRITYENGVGVTWVEIVGDEEKLPRHLLDEVADRAAPLVDAFLFEIVEKKEGESGKIRARDVAGLFPFGREGTATGWVTLRREKDEEPGKVGRLKLVDSEVTVEGRRAAAQERGRLSVKSGTLRCSLPDLYVTSARMTLNVKTLFRSRDHLLFRAQHLRNLEAEVRYSAARVR